MSYKRKSVPRLSIAISEEQEKELRRLIPHGLKKKIFGTLVDGVINLYQEGDPYVITAEIMSKQKTVIDVADKSNSEE